MGSIKDDRGYNQGFKPGKTLTIRTKRRGAWMVRQMDSSDHKDILEIGCGTGELSSILAEKTTHNVLGTDLCAPFIDQAKQNYKLPNLQFKVLDFHNPQCLGEKKFDYIVGNGILHHLYYNLDNSLKALKNLLKDDGKLLFIEPNIYNPYCFIIFGTTPFFRKIANLEPDEMAFSGKYITRLLKKQSYTEIYVEYRDFLLPNTPTFLVNPTIAIGSVLERIPIIQYLSQSVFISARK
ncbi:MAG: class I SAM-dependent methyltransferase [Bacteroidetes bacterium]|nr:class I SAM-dependent methyltransferase [Bacteroidota bacterium]